MEVQLLEVLVSLILGTQIFYVVTKYLHQRAFDRTVNTFIGVLTPLIVSYATRQTSPMAARGVPVIPPLQTATVERVMRQVNAFAPPFGSVPTPAESPTEDNTEPSRRPQDSARDMSEGSVATDAPLPGT